MCIVDGHFAEIEVAVIPLNLRSKGYRGPLVLLILLLCTGCKDSMRGSGNSVSLHPPNSVIVSDPSILTVPVPFGMSVLRKLELRSNFEIPLSQLRPISSCGCTSVRIDKDVLPAGGSVSLFQEYEGGLAPKMQSVRTRIYSAEIASGCFTLDTVFKTGGDHFDIQITSSQRSLQVCEIWKEGRIYSDSILLTFGSKVPRKLLKVTTSSNYISANLQGNLLNILMDSPPVGEVKENVNVTFPDSVGTYSFSVPIQGRISPPITASTSIVNFTDVAPGRPMDGEIFLRSSIASSGRPKVWLEGDWKLQYLENVDQMTWKLGFALNDIPGPLIRFGKILVSGTWSGEDLKILINGNYEK